MNSELWELVGLNVTEVEARVRMQFRGAIDASTHFCGALYGPYCERARTLPAEYPFRDVGGGEVEAIVPDPCLWSEELPNLYRVSAAAMSGDMVLAECRFQLGLQRSRPARNFDGIK